MKHLISLTILAISLNLHSQSAQKWINYPTVVGILEEYQENTRDFLLVEGKVKEISQISYYSPTKEYKVETIAKYASSGQIQSIQTLSTDSLQSAIIRFYYIEFIYDANNQISSERVTDILEGDTIEFLETIIPTFFAPTLPAPIKSNPAGNSIAIVFEEDTTFSFYDEFGRKTMDSIPYSGNVEGYKYKYTYDQDTVFCDHYWSAIIDAVNHKEIFILDQHGNWIEKKEIGLEEIPSGKWTALHRRKITYY
jgi:hypothetical protein